MNNTITLTGNLGANPTTHPGKDGKEFMRLTLCTTDRYKDENDEWKDGQPTWHTVFVYSPKVQSYAAYAQKGQRFKITGKLSYIDRKITEDGKEQTVREGIINAFAIEAAPLTKKQK